MKFLHNNFSYAKNDIISTVVLPTTEIIEPHKYNLAKDTEIIFF